MRNCDQVGCIGRVNGVVVAIARQPALLQEDCRRADILVTRVEVRTGCNKPGLIVDPVRSSRQGKFAIRIGVDGSIDSTSVTDFQGRRPWSRSIRQQSCVGGALFCGINSAGADQRDDLGYRLGRV